MLDLWANLRPIFQTDAVQWPEITLKHLAPATRRIACEYVLFASRELDCAFNDPHTGERLYLGDVGEVLAAVEAGTITASFQINTCFDGCPMPMLVFIFEPEGYLTISYDTGDAWTPFSVMALFALLRWLLSLDAKVRVSLSPRQFHERWVRRFQKILRDYRREQVIMPSKVHT